MKNIVKTLIPLLLIGCSGGFESASPESEENMEPMKATGGFTSEQTGGYNSIGSTGGSDNTGGTGLVGTGGGTCIPKTCEEISIEKTGTTNRTCGLADDGCGGKVVCENTVCSSQVDYSCGKSVNIENLKNALGYLQIESTLMEAGLLYGDDPNICYGGSVKLGVQTNCGPNSVAWVTVARDDSDIENVTAFIQEKQSGQLCKTYEYWSGMEGYITCCYN